VVPTFQYEFEYEVLTGVGILDDDEAERRIQVLREALGPGDTAHGNPQVMSALVRVDEIDEPKAKAKAAGTTQAALDASRLYGYFRTTAIVTR